MDALTDTIPVTDADTLVELSGGMESTTLLHLARKQVLGRVGAIFFDVGQYSAPRQLAVVKRACNELAVPLQHVDTPGVRDMYVDVFDPPYAFVAEDRDSCSVTTQALGYGAFHGYKRVLYGVTRSDLDRIPDLPALLDAIQRLVRLNTRTDIELVTPFLEMTDTEVLLFAQEHGVDLGRTWSCLWGYVHHCGRCERCVKRRRVHEEAGMADPTVYLDTTDLHTVLTQA